MTTRRDHLHQLGSLPLAAVAMRALVGLVHVNLHDLLRYLAAHRDACASLLKRRGWDALHTPPFGGGYALG